MQIARPASRELKSMNTFAFVKTQKVNLAAAFSSRYDKIVNGQEKLKINIFKERIFDTYKNRSASKDAV